MEIDDIFASDIFKAFQCPLSRTGVWMVAEERLVKGFGGYR